LVQVQQGEPREKHRESGAFFLAIFIPIPLLDLKGGSWQVSGGHLQPPWLFRRKASPTGGAKNPECESVRDFTFYFLPITSSLKRIRDFEVIGNK